MTEQQNYRSDLVFRLLSQCCSDHVRGVAPLHLFFNIPQDAAEKVATMSPPELLKLSKALGTEFIETRPEVFLQILDGVIIPEAERKCLKYGASTKALKALFGVGDKKIAKWRKYVSVHPDFTQRTVPIDRYNEIWEDVEKFEVILNPTIDELISAAEKHEMSVGAIWALIFGDDKNEK